VFSYVYIGMNCCDIMES